MDAKITAKVETITPEIAKTMLGENVNNRRISRDNVNLFAREIRNGEWRFNGEAIKFGKDGRLLDGQHRLLAVIAADKPLTTLVIRGLEDETQQTMDSGKTRTLGDVLTLRGEKNSTQLASLARAVYLADQLGMEAAAQNDLKPTRGEIISFIRPDPATGGRARRITRVPQPIRGHADQQHVRLALVDVRAHRHGCGRQVLHEPRQRCEPASRRSDPHTAQHVDGSASQGRPFHPRQPCTHRRIDHQGVEQVA